VFGAVLPEPSDKPHGFYQLRVGHSSASCRVHTLTRFPTFIVDQSSSRRRTLECGKYSGRPFRSSRNPGSKSVSQVFRGKGIWMLALTGLSTFWAVITPAKLCQRTVFDVWANAEEAPSNRHKLASTFFICFQSFSVVLDWNFVGPRGLSRGHLRD
jgi:hypothetical protein